MLHVANEKTSGGASDPAILARTSSLRSLSEVPRSEGETSSMGVACMASARVDAVRSVRGSSTKDKEN